MDIQQKMLKKLHIIEKEIRHSCLYYNNNIIQLTSIMDKHGVDKKGQEIMMKAMHLRYKFALHLLKELEEFVDSVE